MANYWLNLITLDRIAEELATFIVEKVQDKKFNDPDAYLEGVIDDFYSANVEYTPYRDKLSVKCNAVQNPGKYWVFTKVKILILM